ncbi:MAG: CTP synthase [Thermoleophilia bacterium]|nr:CTP synthase [Thermoleophilia bacterium]
MRLDAHTEWVPTDSGTDVTAFDGVWLVPGSPYADDAAVYAALRAVRRAGVPFLGTCGGLQYAAISFLRDIAGVDATHEESDAVEGVDGHAVRTLACDLHGEERPVTPVPGTRFAALCPEPFAGVHHCGYGLTPGAVARLERHGVVVGATAPDAGAEVLEFPGAAFAMACLFQPHIGASRGEPVHPLIAAFRDAAAARMP